MEILNKSEAVGLRPAEAREHGRLPAELVTGPEVGVHVVVSAVRPARQLDHVDVPRLRGLADLGNLVVAEVYAPVLVKHDDVMHRLHVLHPGRTGAAVILVGVGELPVPLRIAVPAPGVNRDHERLAPPPLSGRHVGVLDESERQAIRRRPVARVEHGVGGRRLETGIVGADVQAAIASVEPHPLHRGAAGIEVPEEVGSHAAHGLGVAVGQVPKRIHDPPARRLRVEQERPAAIATQVAEAPDHREPQLRDRRSRAILELRGEDQHLAVKLNPERETRFNTPAGRVDQRRVFDLQGVAVPRDPGSPLVRRVDERFPIRLPGVDQSPEVQARPREIGLAAHGVVEGREIALSIERDDDRSVLERATHGEA